MESIAPIYERVGMLLEQQMPEQVALPVFLAVTGSLTVFGMLVSVLGAKMARSSITSTLATLGIIAGVAIAKNAGLSVLISAALGCAIAGVLGFLLYRLWVGVLAGVFLVTLLNATYGAQAVAPHLASYEASYGSMPTMLAPGVQSIDLESGDDIEINPAFEDWAKGFWDYTGNEAGRLRTNLALASGACGFVGLFLGLLAARFTIVVMTSVIGTSALCTGAIGLIHQFQPQLYEASMANPQAVGIACGAFLLGSLILQTLLTRSNKTGPVPEAKKK